jgi:hypothetical protein
MAYRQRRGMPRQELTGIGTASCNRNECRYCCGGKLFDVLELYCLILVN